MFRRLRTKLIVVCMLLTVATIVPLVVLPYRALEEQSRTDGENKLRFASRELEQINEEVGTTLGTEVEALKNIVEGRFPNVFDPQSLLNNDKNAIEEIQKSIRNIPGQFSRYHTPWILGSSDYAQLESELWDAPEASENPGFLRLAYGELAMWRHRPLFYDGVKVGGALVYVPFLRPKGNVSAMKVPMGYELRVSEARFSGVQVEIPSVENESFVATLKSEPALKKIETQPQIYAPRMTINGRNVFAQLHPFRDHKGELRGVIIFSITRIDPLWDYMKDYMLPGIGLSVIFAVILGTLLARNIASPINRLARTAKKMASGDLAARVEVSGSDEIATLSRAFNDMAVTVETTHSEMERRAQDLQESNRLLEMANHELHRTRELLENILANIRTGVMALDVDGRVIRLNRAAAEILGCKQGDEGRQYHDLVGRSTFAKLIESTLHKGVSIFQREVHQDNQLNQTLPLQVSTVPMLDEGQLIGMVVTFHDLSNIRRLEEQLIRQDRLAALGRLSAGVAHEIRNPLGIMKGSAELLKGRFGGQPGEEGLTDFILDEIDRLSRVVSDFLNFARPPAPSLKRRDVNDIMKRATAFLGHQDTPAPIEYRYHLASDLPPVGLDADLFQQVMLNLLLNAQESMPKGGIITIRTALTESAEVAIEVVDQGVGIGNEAMDQIFDPFFSSKENGTGLGLSVVHQIVVGHGGRIEVESKPDEGSTFRVIMPAFAEETAAPVSAAS